MQNHNDTIIKTSDTVLFEKYTSHFIERVVCERALETKHNCNILTLTLMAISVYFPFSWLLNRGPGGQPLWDMFLNPASSPNWSVLQMQLLNREPGGPASLDSGFLDRILSPTRLIPNWLIGGLRAHSAGCWLSLPHLVSNW